MSDDGRYTMNCPHTMKAQADSGYIYCCDCGKILNRTSSRRPPRTPDPEERG